MICVGEALIDFIGHQPGVLINHTRDYHRYLGGSPTNVAMNLARLGLQPAMVATVGNDGFGEYILHRLEEVHIDTNHLRRIDEEPTSTVFVSRSSATPDFIPYRAADCNILASQLPSDLIAKASIFHTTCFALSKNPARDVILAKAKEASEAGCKLSIDVNYAQKIWPDRKEAAKTLREYCGYNPLIKVSEDDMERYFNKTLSEKEIFDYFHGFGADLICLTLGKNGVKLSQKSKPTIHLPAVKINEVMDATGAGDAFWSGFLYAYVSKLPLEKALEIALRLAALKLQNVGRLPNNINVISDLLKEEI